MSEADFCFVTLFINFEGDVRACPLGLIFDEIKVAV
jgi:hypothetical protein